MVFPSNISYSFFLETQSWWWSKAPPKTILKAWALVVHQMIWKAHLKALCISCDTLFGLREVHWQWSLSLNMRSHLILPLGKKCKGIQLCMRYNAAFGTNPWAWQRISLIKLWCLKFGKHRPGLCICKVNKPCITVYELDFADTNFGNKWVPSQFLNILQYQGANFD